jgi:hypothetical protein
VHQQLADLAGSEELGCQRVLGGRLLNTAGQQQCLATSP